MKIPYGLSNFKDVITQGYVYIDKTDYIAKLEEAGKFDILPSLKEGDSYCIQLDS